MPFGKVTIPTLLFIMHPLPEPSLTQLHAESLLVIADFGVQLRTRHVNGKVASEPSVRDPNDSVQARV